MFTSFIKLFGSSDTLMKFVAGAVILGICAYALNSYVDAKEKLVEANIRIDVLVEANKTLTTEIEGYTTKQLGLDTSFDIIEQSQIDLLCAARYTVNVPVPEKPAIVEVVKYRDRITKCPTTDAAKGEVFDPSTAVLRPVSDEIRTQALNNSWLAYCIATNHEDASCKPFR